MNESLGPLYEVMKRSNETAESTNITDASDTLTEDEDIARDENLAKIEVAVQGIIFILAFLSNSLVILALTRQLRRKPLSRMYRLMFHLSVADLLVAIFNVLPQLIWDITHRFQGPNVLCKFVKFGQIFPIYLSSFLLTLMAIDRVGVTGINNQIPTSNSPKNLGFFIMMAWFLAVLLAMPQFFIFSMVGVEGQDDEGTKTFDCWAHFWGIQGLEKAYVIVFLLVVFFVPFLVISASYCIVTRRIYSYTRSIKNSEDESGTRNGSNPQCFIGDSSCASYHNVSQGGLPSGSKSIGDEDEVATLDTALMYEMKVMGNGNSNQESSNPATAGSARSAKSTKPPCYVFHNSGQNIVLLSKAKKKSLEMTATVSICFAVCWLPYCVTMLILTFRGGEDLNPVMVILALLASLNSTTNPWIYLWFSSAVLQQVKHIVGLRSTLGGPDSLGGADADRADNPNHYQQKRILFKRRNNKHFIERQQDQGQGQSSPFAGTACRVKSEPVLFYHQPKADGNIIRKYRV